MHIPNLYATSSTTFFHSDQSSKFSPTRRYRNKKISHKTAKPLQTPCKCPHHLPRCACTIESQEPKTKTNNTGSANPDDSYNPFKVTLKRHHRTWSNAEHKLNNQRYHGPSTHLEPHPNRHDSRWAATGNQRSHSFRAGCPPFNRCCIVCAPHLRRHRRRRCFKHRRGATTWQGTCRLHVAKPSRWRVQKGRSRTTVLVLCVLVRRF